MLVKWSPIGVRHYHMLSSWKLVSIKIGRSHEEGIYPQIVLLVGKKKKKRDATPVINGKIFLFIFQF